MNIFYRLVVPIAVSIRGYLDDLMDREVHEVDCNAPFEVPNGFVGLQDDDQFPLRTQGKIRFRRSQLGLFLSELQSSGKPITGYVLRPSIHYRSVLTCHFADFFQKHPRLYPRRWIGKRVFLWGNRFSNLAVNDNNVWVRYMFMDPVSHKLSFGMLKYTEKINSRDASLEFVA